VGCPGLIPEFVEKKKKRVLDHPSEGKKKAGTSGLYPTLTGTESQMQQQKKRVVAPNRTCMASKIRFSG
jgi:hypothetical protein